MDLIESRSAQAASADHHFLDPAYWEDLFSAEDPWGYAVSPYEQWKYALTLSVLPPGRFRRGLEVGCAEGHFTDLLASHLETLTAIDISDTAIQRARRRKLPGVKFQVGNMAADALPGRNDLVVCCEVLYYLPQEMLPVVAAKIAGCLAPGGLLLLTHANVVSDDRTRTGFDWGHPFGTRTINETFAAIEGLHLIRALRTPLFTVRLFRNGGDTPPPPVEEDVPLPINLELPASLERTIIWDGAVMLRSEAAQQPPTDHVPILMYHSVADDGPAELAPYRITPRAFREHLLYLRRHGYHAISLRDWAAALAGHRRIEGRPVIITFDDGYRDFAENAFPALERTDFSATVFLVTDRVGMSADWEKPPIPSLPLMGWPEIQMLRAKGIEFGSHSKAHRDLRALPAAEVIADAMASRAILEDKLGGPVTAFSFPWGMETAAARDAVARAGYRVTVSTEPGFSRLGDDPFRLPRIEIMGSDTVADLARKLESPVPAPPAAVDLALPPAPADLDPLPPMAGRSPPAATRAPARLLHPDYLLDLSHRLDALIGEFVTLQNRMLRGFRDGASLQSRLVALFCQPLTGISVRPVSAGATLAPGIHLRFDDGITVNVTVTPKSSHALSPDSHLNSIGLQVSGASTWLALEINLDWPDLSLSRRFQLSLYAEVSRPMACQAFLRLPLRDGSVTESPFSSFVLEPHQGSAVVSGELAVPEFIYLDMQRPPQVLLSLECGSDLSITLHYLNLYFA